MNKPLKILGIPGSLRRFSYNRAALIAAKNMLPEDVTLDVFDLKGLPMFNQDEENQPSPKVVEFKNKIREADAILFSTPEYSYSIPGALKNAIDWASRPYGESPLKGKPVAVMGASVGLFGAASAQYHLRQCFNNLGMFPVNQTDVMIRNAAKAFDIQGTLVDKGCRGKISELLDSLVTWTRELQKSA
ncbi:MAG TPA: NAD(P)H-dependent oxidoreductase [Fluviicoccus sp.]|nr:NAD(P)H-dependent oxidoreductase [Fluviicoccus sp.]